MACVVCDDRGCEFCPGVFTTPIVDRDPGDETTERLTSPWLVTINFKFPNIVEANDFLRNIQKFPHYLSHQTSPIK